jgi:hypothetical protein
MSKTADAQAVVSLQRRLHRVEAELQTERSLRVRSQKEAAGLRSACLKPKALLLKERADKAMAAAIPRTFDAETVT